MCAAVLKCFKDWSEWQSHINDSIRLFKIKLPLCFVAPQNPGDAALYNSVEAAFRFPLSMHPNEQHQQYTPLDPVITENKSNTWTAQIIFSPASLRRLATFPFPLHYNLLYIRHLLISQSFSLSFSPAL